MQNPQVQLKVSLSEQSNTLLKARADQLGLPVTQFVKHIIIKEIEESMYPVFTASKKIQEQAKKSLNEMEKSEEVVDIADYFNKL